MQFYFINRLYLKYGIPSLRNGYFRLEKSTLNTETEISVKFLLEIDFFLIDHDG